MCHTCDTYARPVCVLSLEDFHMCHIWTVFYMCHIWNVFYTYGMTSASMGCLLYGMSSTPMEWLLHLWDVFYMECLLHLWNDFCIYGMSSIWNVFYTHGISSMCGFSYVTHMVDQIVLYMCQTWNIFYMCHTCVTYMCDIPFVSHTCRIWKTGLPGVKRDDKSVKWDVKRNVKYVQTYVSHAFRIWKTALCSSNVISVTHFRDKTYTFEICQKRRPKRSNIQANGTLNISKETSNMNKMRPYRCQVKRGVKCNKYDASERRTLHISLSTYFKCVGNPACTFEICWKRNGFLHIWNMLKETVTYTFEICWKRRQKRSTIWANETLNMSCQ